MLELAKIGKMMETYEVTEGEFYDRDRLNRYLKSFAMDTENDLYFDTEMLVKDINKDDRIVYTIMNLEGYDLSPITRKYPDYLDVCDVIIFSMGLLYASTASPLIEQAIEYFCKTVHEGTPSYALRGYLDGKVEMLTDDDWKYYEEEVDLLFQIADAWYDKMEVNPFIIK